MEKVVNTFQLKNQDVADQFYEERYKEGYMDEWPEWKKLRIIEIIEELNLPDKGKALDFGCGRGIFTRVLKRALPAWDITGCDISTVAINDAKVKFNECRFSLISALHDQNEQFDLIFSHHVLEHVANIKESIQDISKLQSSDGVMLHVMPCGNPNSLEHNLASALPGGLNKELGNRFYFEDTGHMRRFTSAQLDEVLEGENYSPLKAWFANHEFGSLEWMSDYPESFINESLTPIKYAQGDKALEEKLLQLRNRIKRLKLARKFAHQGAKHRIKTRLIELKNNISSIYRKPSQIVSDLILVKEGKQFNEDLKNEWPSKKHVKSGSEMYLAYFKNN